jgi:ubiquitin-protein ligase
MLTCTKRLQKEKAQLSSTNDESVLLTQSDPENLKAWSAIVRGPPGSFYEGYEFDLSITVPAEYPMTPPTIKFVTTIFHPNVLFEVGVISFSNVS